MCWRKRRRELEIRREAVSCVVLGRSGVSNCEGQRRRDRTFGSAEVQHISVFPEHVGFLHTGNGLDVELLQGTL